MGAVYGIPNIGVKVFPRIIPEDCLAEGRVIQTQLLDFRTADVQQSDFPPQFPVFDEAYSGQTGFWAMLPVVAGQPGSVQMSQILGIEITWAPASESSMLIIDTGEGSPIAFGGNSAGQDSVVGVIFARLPVNIQVGNTIQVIMYNTGTDPTTLLEQVYIGLTNFEVAPIINFGGANTGVQP